ncbi:hypothetical protein [Roseiflexus castenholzii]|uniref:hypothetical protein n=1 Tax=Roseiflexus castenholzii TaxID=120962 RepID=UPI0012EDD147|nr:hypothetical protein [Roseiflexus castenholzii]
MDIHIRPWMQHRFDEAHRPGEVRRTTGKQWRRFSGVFVVCKQPWSRSSHVWRTITGDALAAVTAPVLPPVPTHVRT